MRNIKLLVLTVLATLSSSVFAQKTYTFDDGVPLTTDWTVTKNVPSGGNGDCTIETPSRFSAKSGKYMYFVFENKSGITLTVTSAASYNNISNITFDAVANDNSKPNFTLNIVDDNGVVVKNIYTNYTTKDNFNTGGTNKWGVSNSAISPATTGHIQLVLYASSSGKYAAIDNLAVTYQAGPSTDATLKSLKYGNTSVPSFSPSTYTYNVELPAGTTIVPTVTAEKNDSKASNPVITQATSLPGATTVVVTAEDGTTSLTYTINFTVASSYPKVLTATWANIAGTATIDEVNKTITGKVAQGTGLTAITPTFTGNNISSWTPQGAQNFSNGAVNYTFTNSTTGEQMTYAVTITEVPVVHPTSVSLDKTQLNLQVGANSTLTPTVLPTDVTDPSVSWSSNNTAVATVSNGTVTGVTAGTAIITVTTVDGQKTATCSVTVTDAPPVPYTTLTLHAPGTYEGNPKDGGYGANLIVFANREYEVYYINRDEDNLGVSTGNIDKAGIISTSNDKQNATAKDGWFSIATSSNHGGDTNASKADEYETSIRSVSMQNNDSIVFHVKGYDQFSFYGKDNGTDKDKYFHVYIDGVQQTQVSPEATYKIHRYDITPNEHVIRIAIKSGVTSSSKLTSFSLRVAQVPFTKHLKGNDSTQVILQTTAMRPITYYTKYNSIAGAETKLEWEGTDTVADISLETRGQGAVGDTLVVTGTANCPTGVYNFHINTYFNNTLTGSLPGKITVQSDIKALTETYAEGYQGMSIDDINFSYHALSADDITLSWKNNNAPGGINGGSSSEGIYSIFGTPTSTGTFIYTVTVLGGNSITDTLVVKASDIPANAILYLYKNTKAYEKDGVYQYMTGSRNLFPLKATSAGKRQPSEYNKFKWILISQDVDANNPEIIQLIQSRTGLPILNLNGFTYGKDEKRLGWGDPNNGAVDADKNRQGCSITIEQSGHPIFSKMSSPTDGKTVKIVDQYAKNGVMPIDVNNMPSDIASLCLATAHTRGEGYYEEGPLQTAIHEIPPVQGHSKYICLPLAREVTLTAEGKKLIDGIIDYLLSPASTTITAPTLQMNSFAVAGHSATIDQTNDLIVLSLTEKEYVDADSLAAVTPVITVDNPKTHVVPGADEVLDLRFANYITNTFVVTDYVNRRPYTLQLTITKPQGIDEVYTAGQWVNIFDIYGRKVATTNEDVYTMELPHGMYIVVTENGGTIKIMR